MTGDGGGWGVGVHSLSCIAVVFLDHVPFYIPICNAGMEHVRLSPTGQKGTGGGEGWTMGD